MTAVPNDISYVVGIYHNVFELNSQGTSVVGLDTYTDTYLLLPHHPSPSRADVSWSGLFFPPALFSKWNEKPPVDEIKLLNNKTCEDSSVK